MTPSKYPRESRFAAWHEYEERAYRPEPYEPVPESVLIADAAARVARASAAVTTGRVPVEHVTAAMTAALIELAASPADDMAETFADVLAAFDLDADDILPDTSTDYLTAAPGEYLSPADPHPAAPVVFPTTFDPFPTRPHTGRTIRGRRTRIYTFGTAPVGFLTDSADDAERHGLTARQRARLMARGGESFARVSADDAVDMANAYGIPLMMGTDDYHWHDVVHHRPERFDVLTGGIATSVAIRPHDSGASVVGQGDMATSGRRRPPRTVTMPTYRATPDNVTTRTDESGRVWRVSQYRTTHHGRYIIAGDGNGWQDVRRVKRARVKRTPVPVVTRHDAARLIATLSKGDGTDYRHAFAFADGTRATVSHEPAHRRWRVVLSVRLADGTRVRTMTTTRKVATAAARVANAPVSHELAEQ